MIKNSTPAIEEAWTSYLQTLEDVRNIIGDQEWAADSRIRAEGLMLFHQIQALAYNLILSPRQEYPSLYVNTVFEPLVYSHSLPATDFNYRWGFFDGKHDYRLYGKRSGTIFVDCQVMNVFWGGDNPRKIANYDFDENFEIAEDGSFEIIVSAEPRQGNWIQIERDNPSNFLFFREALYDWMDEPAEIHVERTNPADGGSVVIDEAEYVARMKASEKFVRFLVWEWSVALSQRIVREQGYNRFFHESFDADQGGGNSPVATYPTALWDLRGSEAVLVECKIPDSRFWSVQLGDMWWQVKDYTYHQSSLNGQQATIDQDGIFRAIISKKDPGFANWLDPIDDDRGVIIFRFYSASGEGRPTLTPISLAEAQTRLAGNARQVTANERAETLNVRRLGARKRFGY